MISKHEHIDFKSEIIKKGIEYLIHFTPTINLLSIFEQGKIISRSALEKFDNSDTYIHDFIKFSDTIRFDDKSYINLSIQHPNTCLFHRFAENTINDISITWCVLKIDTKYIYQKDTLFSITNAANSFNKKYVGVTGDFQKFLMMFEPCLKITTLYNSRIINRDNLKDKYPTDEQAEVLVKNEIPISDILQVCFKDKTDLAMGKAALSEFDTSKFIIDEKMFFKTRD